MNANRQADHTPPANKGTNKRGGWIFLASVLVIYAALFVLNPALAEKSTQAFLQLTWKILPILSLVFAFMFLGNLLIQESVIRRYVGRSSGWLGYAFATVTGILSTGPIYVWYPLLADLKNKGMREALIAVFLYNRAIKLPWLPVLAGYFGLKYTLVLTLWMITAGLVEGLLMEKILKSPESGTRRN